MPVRGYGCDSISFETRDFYAFIYVIVKARWEDFIKK